MNFHKRFLVSLPMLFFLSLYCSPGITNPIYPDYGLSIASGRGDNRMTPVRLGFQKDFGCRINPDSLVPLGGYFEASLYYMHGKNRKGAHHSNKSLFAGALALVARFEKREKVACLFWPYLDLGIGASMLSKKEIAGRELGIHFQFEDRVGLGVRFGENREYDLGYRIVHFSNAHLGKPNCGLNLHLLVFSYWF